MLAVYTGTRVDSLTRVASNDDIGGGVRQSQVRFTARQGQVYYIAVDGYGGAKGTIELNWQSVGGPPPPPLPGDGDAFADAIQISGASGAVVGSNDGASKEPGEPAHAGNRGGASVWWRWTAPATGEAAFDTRGSSFDTLLAVYTGTRVDSLTRVASNDDIGGGVRQSQVTFTARRGQVYYIAVDGYGGATGNIVLNWQSVGRATATCACRQQGWGLGVVAVDGANPTQAFVRAAARRNSLGGDPFGVSGCASRTEPS